MPLALEHLEIPETPQIAVRLAQARREKEALDVKGAEILIDRCTKLAFKNFAYGKRFNRVRDAAVADVKGEAGAWLVAPMPSLDGFRDQDLRDTAVTGLARAGCTIPMIRAITGHDEKSIYKILKHYLAVDAEMAREAIDRLVVYLENKGVAL